MNCSCQFLCVMRLCSHWRFPLLHPLARLVIENCACDLRVERVSNPTRVHLKHVEALEAYSPADPLQHNKDSCETNNLIEQFLVRVALQPNKGSSEIPPNEINSLISFDFNPSKVHLKLSFERPITATGCLFQPIKGSSETMPNIQGTDTTMAT